MRGARVVGEAEVEAGQRAEVAGANAGVEVGRHAVYLRDVAMRGESAAVALHFYHAAGERHLLAGIAIGNDDAVLLRTAGKGVLIWAKYEREIRRVAKVLNARAHVVDARQLVVRVVERVACAIASGRTKEDGDCVAGVEQVVCARIAAYRPRSGLCADDLILRCAGGVGQLHDVSPVHEAHGVAAVGVGGNAVGRKSIRVPKDAVQQRGLRQRDGGNALGLEREVEAAGGGLVVEHVALRIDELIAPGRVFGGPVLVVYAHVAADAGGGRVERIDRNHKDAGVFGPQGAEKCRAVVAYVGGVGAHHSVVGNAHNGRAGAYGGQRAVGGDGHHAAILRALLVGDGVAVVRLNEVVFRIVVDGLPYADVHQVKRAVFYHAEAPRRVDVEVNVRMVAPVVVGHVVVNAVGAVQVELRLRHLKRFAGSGGSKPPHVGELAGHAHAVVVVAAHAVEQLLFRPPVERIHRVGGLLFGEGDEVHFQVVPGYEHRLVFCSHKHGGVFGNDKAKGGGGNGERAVQRRAGQGSVHSNGFHPRGGGNPKRSGVAQRIVGGVRLRAVGGVVDGGAAQLVGEARGSCVPVAALRARVRTAIGYGRCGKSGGVGGEADVFDTDNSIRIGRRGLQICYICYY